MGNYKLTNIHTKTEIKKLLTTHQWQIIMSMIIATMHFYEHNNSTDLVTNMDNGSNNLSNPTNNMDNTHTNSQQTT